MPGASKRPKNPRETVACELYGTEIDAAAAGLDEQVDEEEHVDPARGASCLAALARVHAGLAC